MSSRIAVLTSGGDSPGMNAAIRSVVRAALSANLQVFGVARGYDGLQAGELTEMHSISVGAIISRGGTILRSARSETFRSAEGRVAAASKLREHEIRALVVIGGDGSLRGAEVLHKESGIPVVGIPASIDNDIPVTAYSIGFLTAVDTAVSAIDKVRDTAYSHERVFVVEVMGRESGAIAVEAGLAGGAEAILIPEVPFELEAICEQLRAGHARGKKSSILVVAEGAARAHDVCAAISKSTGYEARYLVLGHMQRGGAPCAFDRVLATRMGAEAVRACTKFSSAQLVVTVGGVVQSVSLAEALQTPRQIDPSRLELAGVMAL